MKSYEQDDKFKSKPFSQRIPLTFLHKINLICNKRQSQNVISSPWKADNSYFNSKIRATVDILKKKKDIRFAK